MDTPVNFKELPVEDALRQVDSSTAGLSASEAQERLHRYGPNAITEKKRSPLLSFLAKFVHPIAIMI